MGEWTCTFEIMHLFERIGGAACIAFYECSDDWLKNAITCNYYNTDISEHLKKADWMSVFVIQHK